MEKKLCLICGQLISQDTDDDQICDACEETRDELSEGKGDDDE